MNGQGRKLAGVKAIAGFLEVDECTVRRWIKNPKRGAPILKVGGRYFAFEGALRSWLGADAA